MYCYKKCATNTKDWKIEQAVKFSFFHVKKNNNNNKEEKKL